MNTNFCTNPADEDDLGGRRSRRASGPSAAAPALPPSAATRIVGGTIALIAGLLGLLASALHLGIIDGLSETVATLGILDGGTAMIAARAQMAADQAASASTISVLTILFAILAICLPRRWPGAGIVACAIAGGAVGGELLAACMLLAVAGAALVLIGGGDWRRHRGCDGPDCPEPCRHPAG